jgi:hypothetical protein
VGISLLAQTSFGVRVAFLPEVLEDLKAKLADSTGRSMIDAARCYKLWFLLHFGDEAAELLLNVSRESLSHRKAMAIASHIGE